MITYHAVVIEGARDPTKKNPIISIAFSKMNVMNKPSFIMIKLVICAYIYYILTETVINRASLFHGRIYYKS